MAEIRFVAAATEVVNAYQRGETDAYGLIPERRTSDGSGLPAVTVLATSVPVTTTSSSASTVLGIAAYAETGPISSTQTRASDIPRRPNRPRRF